MARTQILTPFIAPAQSRPVYDAFVSNDRARGQDTDDRAAGGLLRFRSEPNGSIYATRSIREIPKMREASSKLPDGPSV